MTSNSMHRNTQHLDNGVQHFGHRKTSSHGNNKKSRLHFLLFFLAFWASAVAFNSCRFFGGGGYDDEDDDVTRDSITADINEDIDIDALFESFALTEEDLAYLKENPIIVTPENSPGNPAFINVTYTDEDYENAIGYAALVTRDMPEADFPEFGIHVNLKPWNLDYPEDSLVVIRMPDKIDEATGSILYTYDCFLLSGQDKFLTDVEITAPVQGDTDAFEGIVTFSKEKGTWEHVYCELAEDRQTFTAYMPHFSDLTQQNALDVINTRGRAAIDLYQQDNKSIFVQLNTELKPKYEGSSHYLYPITVSKTTDFEKFFNQKTRNKMDMANRIIVENGNIPEKDAFMTAMEWLGLFNDIFGNSAGGAGLTKDMGIAFQTTSDNGISLIGKGCTYLGMAILAINVADQLAQDKDWGTILTDKNNMLGTVCAIAGVIGMAAPASSFLALTATVVTGGIFAYTTSEIIEKKVFDYSYPMGRPSSIAEAALHCYMQEYAYSENGYAKNQNGSWFFPSPKPTEQLDSAMIYEHFPQKLLDCNEKNWLAAYDCLIEKYANDPRKMYAAYEKMYDDFADAFWKESPEVRQKYFRMACKKNIEIDMTYTMYHDHGLTSQGKTSLVEKAEFFSIPDNSKYGFSSEAKTEWEEIQQDWIDHAYQLKQQENDIKSQRPKDSRLIDVSSVSSEDVWDAVFRDWDEAGASEKELRYLGDPNKQREAFHDRSIQLLKQRIIPLLHDYYNKKRRQGIMEVRELLDNVIVPLLNTRLTFYAKDLNHPNSPYKTLLDNGTEKVAFTFDCNRTPLFLPRNSEEAQTAYHLDLVVNPKDSVLLETTAYHYLMFGSPTKVKLFVDDEDEPIPAKANWNNVKLETDPNLKKVVQSMEYVQENPQKERVSYYGGGGCWRQEIDISALQHDIIDTKIPIEFRVDASKKKKEGKKKVLWEGPLIPQGDDGLTEEEYSRSYREGSLPWGVLYEDE